MKVLAPWYRKREWSALRAAAADPDRLAPSFEGHEAAHAQMCKAFERQGLVVESVILDVRALIDWCRSKHRPLDVAARQEFAVLTFTERERRAGHA
jgi:hypothetical protein